MSLSKNHQWGFFGSLKMNYGVSDLQASKLFQFAVTSLVTFNDAPEEIAAMFLDSTYGRHFADTLSNHVNSVYDGGGNTIITDRYAALHNAVKKELTVSTRHHKEFQRFVREFQAEETSEFGESKFNKLVQRVLETKG